MLKTILMSLVCLAQCFSLCAQEPSLSGLSTIEYIKLNMTYKKGVFEGYIVFYDASGNPRRIAPPFTCQKKSQSVQPCLYARSYNFKKTLEILPSNFKHYMIDKKTVYAYKLEPFTIVGLEKGNKVSFELEWCDAKAVDTVFILE
jgi:hypothetical protein